MANGLVYTQVREGAGEGLRVKRSLAHKVRKVKKVHAGPPFSRTVYTNKGGGSLLRSFQRSFNQMEEHISALRNQVTNQGQQIKDQDQKIKDQGQQIGDQGQQIEDQGEGQKLLNKEVMTLNPLKDTAISIRKRLFATYRWGGVNEKKDDDEETINIGNIQAHTGNVRLDVHLFRNNLIEHDDSETFLSLYGTSWERAEVVTGMLPPFVYLCDPRSYYLYF